MNEKRIFRVTIVISDYHLGAGRLLIDGRLNKLEDFKDIDGYRRLLKAIRARYPEDVVIELEWNGDMIDFNPIRRGGSLRIEPTEEAALEELETCLHGNTEFFDATAEFLTWPNTSQKVRIGNHDLPLVWPRLQARLRERLLPHGPDSRLRFVYGEELDGRVLKLHGDKFDPFNANPPAGRLFSTGKADRGPLAASLLAFIIGGAVARGVFWTGAKDFTLWRAGLMLVGLIAGFALMGMLFSKIAFWRNGPDYRRLNLPYGTYLDTFLVALLKPWFPWYGRTVGMGHALAERISVLRNWRYIGLTVMIGIPHLLLHAFIHPWREERDRTSLFRSLRVLLAMTKKPNIQRSIRRLLRKYPGAKWVVIGHYHTRIVLPIGRGVTLVDCGTGIEQIRMGLIEGGFFTRIIRYWKRHPKLACIRAAVHLVLAAIPFGLNLAIDGRHGIIAPVFAACMGILLLVRQSYALEEKQRFTEFTPTEILTYEDGSQRVRSLTFNQHAPEGTDPFSTYLET